MNALLSRPVNDSPTVAVRTNPIDPKAQAARVVASGRRVIEIEAAAIAALGTRLDGAFSQACALMLGCEGRVVVTGVGKSGHIAHKIAATLASTGTPAFFVHPTEASHGDLGMITPKDLVLALSNSGETDELLTILPVLKRKAVPLIAMSGNANSTLSKFADVHLDVEVSEEACPLGLAPTASTTAALVMGDALAIALLEARGFTADDFAASHPAGRLGRRLLVHISDVMHTGAEIPRVGPDASLTTAMMEMTRKNLGMTAIATEDDRLRGVFTDGDLRRALDDATVDMRTTAVSGLMTVNPRTISADRLAIEAARMMEAHKINALLVVDAEGLLVGALNFHDLLLARVI